MRQPTGGLKTYSLRQWLDTSSNPDEGQRMISAADVYREAGDPRTGAKLRRVFEETRLLTRDLLRIKISESSDLTARLKDAEETVLQVPYYDGTPISEADVSYLQTLFNTHDSPEAVVAVLEELAGRPAQDIRLSTPTFLTRRDGNAPMFTEIPVEFGLHMSYRNGAFHISTQNKADGITGTTYWRSPQRVRR